LYQLYVRPRLSRGVKNRLKRRLLPRMETVMPQPSMETIDRILERVRPDGERFMQLLGLETPWWDLDAVRAKYAQPQASPEVSVR
ncbi:MAG: hypothetical protein ACODAQ_11265, partial [Phycisphaeraceae bacterium]